MIKGKLLDKFKAFLYPVLAGVRFNVGGQLGLNELMALFGSFSITQWKRQFKRMPDTKKLTYGYLIFLISQMVSDAVNHSSSSNFLRGWAHIVMSIIVTNFLARLLFRSPNLIVLYLVGEILRFFFFGADTEGGFAEMGVFKFYFVPILNPTLLIVSWYFLRKNSGNKHLLACLFIFYGLLCIALDARSNGVLWILTAIIFTQVGRLKNVTWRKALPLVLFFVIIFQILYMFYVSAVLSGEIGGEHSKEQFDRVENPYNPLSLLATGRAETFVAIEAIKDKPIFGHGSWAPDTDGRYTYIMYQMHGEEEKFLSRLEGSDGGLIIPSHSILAGVWLSAGLLGFMAIVYILRMLIIRFFRLFRRKSLMGSPFAPIIIYFFFFTVWTFLFSPLSHMKDSLPITIALVLVLNKRSEIAANRVNSRISKNTLQGGLKYSI